MNAVDALDAFRRAVEEQLRGHVARERYLAWRLEMAESRKPGQALVPSAD